MSSKTKYKEVPSTVTIASNLWLFKLELFHQKITLSSCCPPINAQGFIYDHPKVSHYGYLYYFMYILTHIL